MNIHKLIMKLIKECQKVDTNKKYKLDKFIFNRLIIMERKAIKLTQESFGKILDVDGKTVSAYENFQIFPSAEVIEKLLKHFGYKIMIIDRFNEPIEFY